jgi:hypothetical protein
MVDKCNGYLEHVRYTLYRSAKEQNSDGEYGREHRYPLYYGHTPYQALLILTLLEVAEHGGQL